MDMMHVKKGDTVIVISGKDKGKKGKVIKVLPKKVKLLVEGVNMVTKHQKPSKLTQKVESLTKKHQLMLQT